MKPRRRDAVDVITRESTRRVTEPRRFRDGFVATQVRAAVVFVEDGLEGKSYKCDELAPEDAPHLRQFG